MKKERIFKRKRNGYYEDNSILYHVLWRYEFNETCART